MLCCKYCTGAERKRPVKLELALPSTPDVSGNENTSKKYQFDSISYYLLFNINFVSVFEKEINNEVSYSAFFSQLNNSQGYTVLCCIYISRSIMCYLVCLCSVLYRSLILFSSW